MLLWWRQSLLAILITQIEVDFCQNLVLNYTVQSLQPPQNYTVYLIAGFDLNWNRPFSERRHVYAEV